jgi:threonine synthase
MLLYSTKNPTLQSSFLQAALQGLAPDGGLWMPNVFPTLPASFFANLDSMPFADMAVHVMEAFLGDEIAPDDLESLVRDAFTFDAPLVHIAKNIYVLELFHGPTLAFKDFGARFMARMLSYGLQNGTTTTTAARASSDLCVLVATSGDTGSAVAHGFWNVPGIRVVILYPQGKVSDVQEKQLTTMGANVSALEVQGTFDDCQHLVKTAFQDADLNAAIALTSANSINIARLLPQCLYYYRAIAQLPPEARERVVFCTPSGNFGNLTGGLFAKRTGLNVAKFLAATNRNDTFTGYIETGKYTPKPSVETPSNAMDVGNPSNFVRIQELYNGDINTLRQDIAAARISDEETVETVARVEGEYHYLLCPHTAVGYAALERYLENEGEPDATGIVLATAHPAKFGTVIEPALGKSIPLPERLQDYMRKEKHSTVISNDYQQLKAYLMAQ